VDDFNSCVSRISKAFNYSKDAALYYARDLEGQKRGHGIPRGALPCGKVKRWNGGDGLAYGVYTYVLRHAQKT